MLSSLAYRKHFLAIGPRDAFTSSEPLSSQLIGLIAQRMPSARFSVTDAVRVGDQTRISRVYLTVGTLEEADSMVRWRHCLRGSGFTLYEVLSPVESAAHQALWPLFVAARALGKRTQLNRARLTVDGIRISPPSSA